MKNDKAVEKGLKRLIELEQSTKGVSLSDFEEALKVTADAKAEEIFKDFEGLEAKEIEHKGQASSQVYDHSCSYCGFVLRECEFVKHIKKKHLGGSE